MRVGRTGGSAQIPDRSCRVGVHGKAHVHVVPWGRAGWLDSSWRGRCWGRVGQLERQGGLLPGTFWALGAVGSEVCCASVRFQVLEEVHVHVDISGVLVTYSVWLVCGVGHSRLGREAEKVIPFCSTMCGLFSSVAPASNLTGAVSSSC